MTSRAAVPAHLFADHLEDTGIVQGLTPSHLGVLSSRHHQTNRRLTALIAAADGILQIAGKSIFESHIERN